MCFGFGESKPTETRTSTGNTATTNAANTANNSSTSLPAWLTNASQGNLSFLNNLRDAGYQEYTAPRVADLSNDENTAYGMIRALAGTGNQYSPEIASLFRKVGSTAPDTLSTTRAIDNVPGQGASGSTQDYMNPFIDAVLAPQLRELDRNQTLSQNNLDASRTMGGAFGDARSGFEAAENTRNFTNAKIDTTGKANADAFDRAMALKTNDISRLLDVSKSNAALKEQGLARALAGGNALMGLDRYDTGRQADLAGMLERAGASQRGVQQAKLDAAYQEFSKKTGFPLELSKLILQRDQRLASRRGALDLDHGHDQQHRDRHIEQHRGHAEARQLRLGNARLARRHRARQLPRSCRRLDGRSARRLPLRWRRRQLLQRFFWRSMGSGWRRLRPVGCRPKGQAPCLDSMIFSPA